MTLCFPLLCALLSILACSFGGAFSIGARSFAIRRQPRPTQFTVPKISLNPPGTGPSLQELIDQADTKALIRPTVDDAAQLARILGTITESMHEKPEKAFATALNETSWLCSRNVPELANLMLAEQPALRDDEGMMQAYVFLLHFLETFNESMGNMVRTNQALLKELLDAAKVSEQSLDQYVEDNRVKLLDPDFFVYLDTELASGEEGGPAHSLLLTVHLRLLEERGNSLDADVALLPRLALETDPAELKKKTEQHLAGYDKARRELFLQNLRTMRADLETKYQNVDPSLVHNLMQIQLISERYVKRT